MTDHQYADCRIHNCPLHAPQALAEYDQHKATADHILDAYVLAYVETAKLFGPLQATAAMAESIEAKAQDITAAAQYLAFAIARLGEAWKAVKDVEKELDKQTRK